MRVIVFSIINNTNTFFTYIENQLRISKNPNSQTPAPMADVEAVDEGGKFPEKRKLDLPISKPKPLEDAGDKDDFSKRQKIDVPAGTNGSVPLAAAENAAESEEHAKSVAAAAAAEEDEEDDEDEEDYNAEQEEDGDDEVYGEAGDVDRKGKGIVVDRKGKGKMIEESDEDDSDGRVDDDDDDSSDDSGSDFSDGLDESDLEEDPLAEVDLDNILPSRTRRSRAQPGVRISSDPGKGNDA